MREISAPLTVEIPTTGSLTDDIIRNAREAPSAVSFSKRTGREWSDVTAVEFLAQVKLVAKGLIASGINVGDRVGIVSRTRFEWALFDYAIWYAGAVTVPIYDNASYEQIRWVFQDSGATTVVAETSAHAARIDEARAGAPHLAHVWEIDAGAVEVLSTMGRSVGDVDLEARRASATPDSIATIIYTSGTTGDPKGCILTHGNFMFELDVAVEELRKLFDSDDASTLLFLPLAHVFARVIQVGAIKSRVRMAHSSDITHLPDDLATFRPTFLLGVPRIFEQLFTLESQRAAADGKSKLFDKAADTAIAYSQALDGGHPGWILRARHAAFERRVYARLRASLGGNCQHAISGGAPLGERLGHFYRGIGLTVLEGYGLTESTAALTLNRPGMTKIGTVGRPLPGTTIRVADDGELLARGPQVFAGYWNDAEATTEVLSPNGWLHTGDLGEIDDEGFVRITGRKKEIIVTAGGKNVAPSLLEDRVRAHPLVSQCMVVGEGQPFVAALITLDSEAVSRWAKSRGTSVKLTGLLDDPDLRAQVQAAVDEANSAVSQAESIRKFTILATDWTEESGHLTPSLKVRRHAVSQDFRAEIDALFPM